jgi:hypothetical protein
LWRLFYFVLSLFACDLWRSWRDTICLFPVGCCGGFFFFFARSWRCTTLSVSWPLFARRRLVASTPLPSCPKVIESHQGNYKGKTKESHPHSYSSSLSLRSRSSHSDASLRLPQPGPGPASLHPWWRGSPVPPCCTYHRRGGPVF